MGQRETGAQKSTNLRSGRLNITKVLRIHLIHLGVVLHIRKENVDFDNVVETGPRLFKNRSEVTDNLMLLGMFSTIIL